MERFLERHQSRVMGVLTGFDRVLFRGTLRSISYLDGLQGFLKYHGILYKDFGQVVKVVATPQRPCHGDCRAVRSSVHLPGIGDPVQGKGRPNDH